MSVITLTVNGQDVAVPAGSSLLEATRAAAAGVPTLCHLDGLTPVAACRLCLVEVEGAGKLLPACSTEAAEGMVVHTHTPRLREFRRMAVELFFAEGNHVCAVCVANRHCELQDMAVTVGMDHSRFPYQYPHRSRGRLPPPVHPRPQPLHPLHPLRAGLRRDRGGPRLGHRQPRRPVPHRRRPR